VTLQFNRKCVLRVGTDDAIEIRCSSASGLRAHFVIDKQLLGFPNTAIIKVYNLSESSRAKLREKGARVELLVGYDPNRDGTDASLTRLFLGDLVNINDVRENPDTVTTLWARDGYTAYTDAVTSAAFVKGTGLKQILKKSFEDMKKASRNLIMGANSIEDKKLTAAMSFGGQTTELLAKLAKTYGFNWMIQDEELSFQPAASADGSIPLVVINKFTGMVGSPTVTEIGANVSLLLNPTVLPAGIVQIGSDLAQVSLGNLLYRPINKTLGEGLYRVNRVIHTGDTRGNSWRSAITGRTL